MLRQLNYFREMNLAKTHPFHLGRLFGKFTKQYIGFITKKLDTLPIERYYYVLLLISKAEPALTQKDLTEILDNDKSSTVRLLDYLQDHGMIERSRNPNDRREHFLALTSKAEKYIPEIEKAFNNLNEKALQGISDSEKESFYKILGKMISNLSQEPIDNIFLDFNKINPGK